MKILIIGFQRSGTTFLRRIVHTHPEVKSIFHEIFLFKKYNNIKRIRKFLHLKNIDIEKDTWGEKCPFYPNVRKIPTLKYCSMWLDMFGKDARIIHVVRHPIDVALSIKRKYKNINKIDEPIRFYNTYMPQFIPVINKLPQTLTFKYEEMILNPDIVVPEIYKFCNIDDKVDFREFLKKLENPKYRDFNPSRVFAYKKANIEKISLSCLDVINNISGIKYEEN